MKQFLTMMLLFVGGCLWVPDEFPAIVDMGSSLSDEQAEQLIEACDEWNDTIGSPVFKPVQGNGRRIQRGRIHVDDSNPRAPSYVAAEAVQNPWSCRIRADDVTRGGTRTFVHELGHCLGLLHDELPNSIMAAKGHDGQRILPQHVEHVKILMELVAESNTDDASITQNDGISYD